MESKNQFIVANTVGSSLAALGHEHIIPVFAKDNEVAISHQEFIQQCYDATQHFFGDAVIPAPEVRVSHPIHGRIPEAMHKKPAELLDHEKTLYYERMMFLIQVPSVTKVVDGKVLNLVIAGVKAFNQDKLHGKTVPQRFSLAIGFQVHVCSNLCIFADGQVKEINTTNPEELYLEAYNLCAGFDPERYAHELQQWSQVYLSALQFKEFVGRIRVDYYDPEVETKHWLGDQQMAKVVKGYYGDPDFKSDQNGNITLWNLYNLMTRANQTSYIDTMLDRSVSALEMLSI